MASFTVTHRKLFPTGGLYCEIVRLTTAAATSVSTALDYTSQLRVIEQISDWGKLCTPSLATSTAVTWTNASQYGAGGSAASHALLTISGIDAANSAKTFDLVIFGKV